MVKQNSKKTALLVKNNNRRRRKNTKKHTIAYGKAELKDDHIVGDKNTQTHMVKAELAADYNTGEK